MRRRNHPSKKTKKKTTRTSTTAYTTGSTLRNQTQDDRVEERKLKRVQRQKAEKSTRLKGVLIKFVSFVVLVIVILALLSRLFVGGAHVTLGGAQSPESQAVLSQAADDYLDASFFRKFKVGINKAQLQEELEQLLPQYDSVKVDTSLFSNKVEIRAIERSPEVAYKLSGNESYLLDNEGVAYLQITTPVKGDLIKVADQTRIDVEVGDEVLARSTILFMNNFSKLLEQNTSLKINSFSINETPRLVTVSLNNAPYQLKLNTARGAGEQMQDLVLVLKHLKKSNITPVSHVDLRIPDKTFYK